ncbi:uncharacterized protein isoform X2 [Rhodnius prolixus]|uniref:uncharacterized protein isoform X2 n=1 Tax=Rhodnius prolixus TaxID=13249 RepID=UPI003D18B1CA
MVVSGKLIAHIEEFEARIKAELNALKQILLKMETSLLDFETKLTALSNELGKKYLSSSNTNSLMQY